VWAGEIDQRPTRIRSQLLNDSGVAPVSARTNVDRPVDVTGVQCGTRSVAWFRDLHPGKAAKFPRNLVLEVAVAGSAAAGFPRVIIYQSGPRQLIGNTSKHLPFHPARNVGFFATGKGRASSNSNLFADIPRSRPPHPWISVKKRAG
jgi:hypothetical protein